MVIRVKNMHIILAADLITFEHELHESNEFII